MESLLQFTHGASCSTFFIQRGSGAAPPRRPSEGGAPRGPWDPLPIGPDAPQVELFGPEQPNPAGLELMQQGQLEVVPMGPLFEGNQKAAQPLASEHLPC